MDKSIKNILIVCHHYPPHITGVGRVAQNQAKYLAKLGNNVTVVTSKTSKDEINCTFDGVKIIRIRALNFLENFNAPFPIFSPWLIFVLFKKIKNADVVHVHDGFYMSSFFAVLIAKILKKPVFLTQHVSWVMHPSNFIISSQKFIYATTGMFVFKYCDVAITYNDRVEDFLKERGIKESKLVRLTNGVDNNRFFTVDSETKNDLKLKFGFNLNKKTIIFVGRFVPKKGFDKVLASRSDKYQIVFVGGDAVSPNTEDIIYLGKISQHEIAKVYQASDILVLPSESEGFPLSIQEAMACGLPIITASDDGYRSYNLDKDLFKMIENPTKESVKEAIESIYTNEDLLKKMSDYSVKYSSENFDWENTVSRLNNIYESVVLKKQSKKKIAFVSDAIYLFNKGGKEKRLFDITTRLAKDGYDVTVYCMKWWQGSDILESDGVKYVAISPLYPLYHDNRRSIRQAVLFAIHSLKLVGKSFDILDVDHIPHLVLFTTKIVCVLKRKEMIATWHEVWGRGYWMNYLGRSAGFFAYFIERISSKLPNKIISVSGNTTNDLISVLGVDKRKIYTIPNGLDFDIINSSTFSDVSSDIVYAGRLLPNKNVDVLIGAISELKSRGILYSTIIVGEGPERTRLAELALKLGLEKQVNFLDFFEKHSDLFAIIKSSKVFVLPSTREGFGIAAIEANACGLPIITVDGEQNAAKDLVINSENGLVCKLDNVSMADAIESVLNSRKEAEYYKKYSDQYDWKVVFPSILKVYK